jgi:reverse gyrase
MTTNDFKFAFILQEQNAYLNQEDVTSGSFAFLTKDIENLKFKFDKNGIAFIQEDVNRPTTDKIEDALKQKEIPVKIISRAKWNEFDSLN